MIAAADLWHLLVRSTFVLAGGAAIGWALRRADPTVRHRLWAATLGGAAVTGVAPWVGELIAWRAPAGLAFAPPDWLDERIAFAGAACWGLGILASALRVVLALAAGRRLVTGARPLDDADWRAAYAQTARDVGLRVPVRMCVSEATRVPLTLGTRRPVVVLPGGSVAWSPARRRAVLLHELAHVRRRDSATELFVRCVCAAYWCHPGVWWAARRLRQAREEACDAAVLRAGTPPADYAEHLVALLRAAGGSPSALAVGLGTGGRSNLERRILCLSGGSHPRRTSAVLRWAGLLPFVAGLALGAGTVPARATSPLTVASAGTAGSKPPCDCRRKLHQVERR